MTQKETEVFWLSAGTEPAFPLKCVACPATHNGGIAVAIDDGWNFCVYTLRSGVVQFAGCPAHFSEFEKKSLAFLNEKTS
jgi:hypothetical protein